MADRKSLAKTYTRSYIEQVGIKQVVEDSTEQRSPPLVRPVSAGGMIPGGAPAAMSQEYLMFVDGMDELPERLRLKAWAVCSRMLQLTYIPDYDDAERLTHGAIAILINMAINDEITLKDYQDLLFFFSINMRKAVKGIERKHVSPVYSEVAHQELTSKSILEERTNSPAATGLMARIGSKMRM
jgi:hypothetical protein